ncbi:MAG: hypothetical protein SFY92_12115 [Verrucomicrobiae bacterium]|nr:hypothetical protein [Verrucomicrobiae bacterium]
MVFESRHHTVPKARGGRETTPVCRDCHDAIHACFSLRELERSFCTLDSLFTREEFSKMIRFIARQNPHARVRTRRPKENK